MTIWVVTSEGGYGGETFYSVSEAFALEADADEYARRCNADPKRGPYHYDVRAVDVWPTLAEFDAESARLQAEWEAGQPERDRHRAEWEAMTPAERWQRTLQSVEPILRPLLESLNAQLERPATKLSDES